MDDGRGERPDCVSVALLLGALKVAWSPECAAKGRPLTVGLAPAGLSVPGDRERLQQAVGTLIANALDHGAGEIELRVRVAGDRLRLEVHDGGRGLGRPLAEVLRRARSRIGRRRRGLAFADAVAARYGGRLATAPAHGAALVLELPLARGAAR
jgi:signal transduction histidine kinase